MAIYKKGTTQAQKTKSIVIWLVLLFLLSIPVYNIIKYISSKSGNQIAKKSGNQIANLHCTLSSVIENGQEQTVTGSYVTEFFDKDITLYIYYKDKMVISSGLNFGKVSVWNDNVIKGHSADSLTGNGNTIYFNRNGTLNRKSGRFTTTIKTSGAVSGITYIEYMCDNSSKKF